MLKTIRTIGLYVGIGVIMAFILFTINQVIHTYNAAYQIHPIAGWTVASALTVTFLGLFGIPFIMYLRLPKSLSPSKDESEKEFEKRLDILGNRLEENERLSQSELNSREDIEDAIDELDSHAEDHIHEAASGVFMSTAVSQSGRLDGLLVLAAQMRMVWHIAHLYYQRPTLRDLVWLYSQVAMTTFLAAEIDDVDLDQEIEPWLDQAFGAVLTSIPLVKQVTSFLAESTLTGTANAFFTLRVGVIAKEYCGMLTMKSKRQIRNSATKQASTMLRSVVKKGSGKLAKIAKDVAANKSKEAGNWARNRADEHRKKASNYYDKRKENAKEAWGSFRSTVNDHREKLLDRAGLVSSKGNPQDEDDEEYEEEDK